MIKIDHHPNDDPYGDLNWVLPEASSTSEIIIDIVNDSQGRLQFNDAAARVLYAGMVGDTGRFMFDSTSPHTMNCAAQMMTFDIQHAKINQRMNEITLEQAKLQGTCLTNYRSINTMLPISLLAKRLKHGYTCQPNRSIRLSGHPAGYGGS